MSPLRRPAGTMTLATVKSAKAGNASVTVPEASRPYMGGVERITR